MAKQATEATGQMTQIMVARSSAIAGMHMCGHVSRGILHVLVLMIIAIILMIFM